MAKYIGITIGPLMDTISIATDTRSTWRASYLFSYIMKTFYKKLKEVEKEGYINVLIPSCADSILTSNNRAGLFHDRIILKINNNFSLDNIEKIKNEIFSSISKEIITCLGADKDISNELCEYFKLYSTEYNIKIKHKALLELSDILDTLELQPQLSTSHFEYITKFLHKKDYTFLEEDAFGKNLEKDTYDKKNIIKSTPEIAWVDAYNELSDKNKKEINDNLKKGQENGDYKDDYESYKLLKNLFPDIKKYNYYYAVVRADGDNLGNAIKNLKTNKKINEFSENLFNLSVNSVDKIEEYGGLPIFIGGDDLLFLAPIKNGNANILSLINELSNEYKTTINNSTLSFGVSIVYYKHPLIEAINDSASQLFDISKSFTEKNALTINLIKGGNREIVTTISNKSLENYGSPLYHIFSAFLLSDSIILKTIIHTLEIHREILSLIIGDTTKIDLFFENYFNEQIHKTHKKYLEDVKIVFNEITKKEYSKENISLNNFFGYFRILLFLNERGGE